MATFLRFHTGASLARSPSDAAFAAIADAAAMPPLSFFAQGTPDYPDRSTTLIVQVETLANDGWRLEGPGIRGSARLSAAPLPADFVDRLRANRAAFPCGVDIFLASDSDHRRPASQRARERRRPDMYVAVKGGEAAISAAHELLARERRGDPGVPEITPEQIREQLTLAVNRVMCEGSLYDPELAALAVKQARGDLIEAIFLLRAYRTTLPRLGYAEPVDTAAMRIRRRISATYKDLPGGQLLGPTFDYTHRLLDAAPARRARRPSPLPRALAREEPAPHVTALLDREGLIEPNAATDRWRTGRRHHARSRDVSRRPRPPPAGAGARRRGLPAGARLLDAARLRAHASLRRRDPHGRGRGRAACRRSWALRCRSGASTLTECEMVNQFKGSADAPPQFTRGYGLVFGHSERKAMAMALVDRALRARGAGPGGDDAGAGPGVRAVARRQRAGDGLRRAPEAAALRRLPGRARPAAPAARGVAGGARGSPGRGCCAEAQAGREAAE